MPLSPSHILLALTLSGLSIVSWAGQTEVRATLQNSQPKYILYNEGSKGLCGDIYQRLGERLAKHNTSLSVPSHYSLIKVILDDLKTGKADIYCGAGRNAKREAKYNYSSVPTYSVSNIVVVHRDDKTEPQSMMDLIDGGEAIASYNGTSTASFLFSHKGIIKSPNIYKNLLIALQAVASNKERYFFYHDLALPYLISKHQLPLRIVKTKFRSYQHWMLYSKTMSTELKDLIDQELVAMSRAGELAAIQAKYMHSQP